MLTILFLVINLPQVQSAVIAMGEDEEHKPCILDPTVFSPAIAVTVWSVSIDFSLSPFSIYMGDEIRFSGKLQEFNGTSTIGIASKPVTIIISNPSVTTIVASTPYTCTDGTFTLAYSVSAVQAVVGANYFYAKSSW
jgi:hypothetical protein